MIVGGENNPSLQVYGHLSPLGNTIVDLGMGPLGSKGLNNFLNTTGAHTWVEATESLSAKNTWFGGDEPVDAGVGGVVDFTPTRTNGPLSCNVPTLVNLSLQVKGKVRAGRNVKDLSPRIPGRLSHDL